MADPIEPETISRAVNTIRGQRAGSVTGADLMKMMRFLNDQMLAASYNDLN